jgi:hypothetical protein
MEPLTTFVNRPRALQLAELTSSEPGNVAYASAPGMSVQGDALHPTWVGAGVAAEMALDAAIPVATAELEGTTFMLFLRAAAAGVMSTKVGSTLKSAAMLSDGIRSFRLEPSANLQKQSVAKALMQASLGPWLWMAHSASDLDSVIKVLEEEGASARLIEQARREFKGVCDVESAPGAVDACEPTKTGTFCEVYVCADRGKLTFRDMFGHPLPSGQLFAPPTSRLTVAFNPSGGVLYSRGKAIPTIVPGTISSASCRIFYADVLRCDPTAPTALLVTTGDATANFTVLVGATVLGVK